MSLFFRLASIAFATFLLAFFCIFFPLGPML